ncbi:uncharacterized conserved small protein [Beggiatoa alba B18LD]|uniref:Uncharacterized conserved small protein n=1 Tax=Beggiatoa alba B18LD TaxID=395493 RepID=I3CCH6_9GAMM|nr:DUF2288 domain-containing protein [Beggiatoa alba]EIJ41319.1 uncharacterized conserved small protein [Beggiatoa alba B18LD]
MIENDDITQDESLFRAKVNLETSRITWQELQRFFASGLLIAVSNELDLVQVALEMSRDNKVQWLEWMQARKIVKVSDTQAIQWHERNASLWAVVVKPWVLVQDKD